MDWPQGISLIVAVLAGLAIAATLHYRRRLASRFALTPFPGDFPAEHHFPDVVPVPPSQLQRFREGECGLEELVGWIRQFLGEVKAHPQRPAFELAVRKWDFYRDMSDMMGRGRWGDVDELATRLAEIDPLDPSAALMRGRANRELGQFASAIRFYQEALKLRPTHSLALPELAATCRVAGQPHRFQPALDVARRELGETHPLTIESRVALGELVRVFADPTDAATVSHIPRDQYVRIVRSRMEESEPDLDSVVASARGMVNEDMPELAEALADRCQQWFGDPPQALVIRGMAQRHQRDFAAAEELLKQALEADDTAEARLELARTFLDKAKARPALADECRGLALGELRLAVDRDPNLTEAVALLARPDAQIDSVDIQLHLERLAAAYPAAWGPWKVLGDLHAIEDRWEQAAQAYEQALKREPADEALLPYLAVLAQLQREPQMLEVVQKITGLAQRDPLLRWRSAQVLFKGGQVDSARGLLKGIVDDDGAAPPLRQQARDVLARLDEEREAEEKKNKAAE